MASKTSSARLTLASILSAVGAASAVYLTEHFYALRLGTQNSFKSLCNVSQAMNCDVVALNRWAETFGGVPLSSFVAGWFVALLLVTLCARSESWKKDSLAVGTLMAGFGSLYSLLLLAVMILQIKVLCLFCLVIDGVNFALLGVLWSMKDGPLLAGFDRGKLKSFLGLILVPLLVMVVILRPAETEKAVTMPKDETDAAVQEILASKVEEFPSLPASQSIGPADAPITIVEFSDFQCPFCRKGAYILNSVLNRYPNDVRVVFRAFPLDSHCNPKGGPMHPYSCMLSRAAVCAAAQGQFEPMYQSIFDAQDSLHDGIAEEIAKDLKLDVAKLKSCMDEEATQKTVVADMDEGFRVGVAATPTFFINGHRVEGAYPLEVWERVIDSLLGKKK